jgi:nitroreductase
VDFADVVRRRRMVRRFDDRLVPPELVDRVLEVALHAPSAGFSQGLDLLVLDRAEQVRRFFELVDPWGRRHGRAALPAVVVLPFPDKDAYLRRYARPDKAALGMDTEAGWPVAYWDLDVAMATMLVLLAATDAGLGAWFFGLFHGEAAVLEWLGVPEGRRPIGAVALGYPAPDERPSGSPLTRRRRTLDSVVHRGEWRHRETRPT